MRTIKSFAPILFLLAWVTAADARPDHQRSRAEAAVKKLAGARNLTVRWRADRSKPALLRGLSVATTGDTVAARALGFLGANPDIFLPTDQLRLAETRGAGGLSAVRFRQVTKGGIPVDGGEVTVALDGAGTVSSVHSELITLAGPIPRAKLNGQQALAVALGRLAGKDTPLTVPRELASLRPGLVVMPGLSPRLVYRVMLPLWLDILGRVHLVDAVTGDFIGWRQAMKVDGHQHGKASGVTR